MLIGKVIGEIVASEKHPSHEGLKLLTVAVMELDGSLRPDAPHVAVDSLGAGIGDQVLITLDGFGAMSAVDRKLAPIDCAVVGIVDEIQLAETP
jgi:ethanolamine utilization protein EutN